MVSKNIDDLGAFASLTQQFLDNVTMLLRPINRPSHRPNINQISHDVERFKLGLAQKLQQSYGLAPRVPRCTSEIQPVR